MDCQKDSVSNIRWKISLARVRMSVSRADNSFACLEIARPCHKAKSGITIQQLDDNLEQFIGSFPGPEGVWRVTHWRTAHTEDETERVER